MSKVKTYKNITVSKDARFIICINDELRKATFVDLEDGEQSLNDEELLQVLKASKIEISIIAKRINEKLKQKQKIKSKNI